MLCCAVGAGEGQRAHPKKLPGSISISISISESCCCAVNNAKDASRTAVCLAAKVEAFQRGERMMGPRLFLSSVSRPGKHLTYRGGEKKKKKICHLGGARIIRRGRETNLIPKTCRRWQVGGGKQIINSVWSETHGALRGYDVHHLIGNAKPPSLDSHRAALHVKWLVVVTRVHAHTHTLHFFFPHHPRLA